MSLAAPLIPVDYTPYSPFLAAPQVEGGVGRIALLLHRKLQDAPEWDITIETQR